MAKFSVSVLLLLGLFLFCQLAASAALATTTTSANSDVEPATKVSTILDEAISGLLPEADKGKGGKGGKGKPKPRHPVRITEKLYKSFKVFATYSWASTVHPCPHPPYGSKVVEYISVKKTTTQAALFRDDGRKQFILAFPGTHGKEDASLDTMADLVPFVSPGITQKSCPGCMVHQGFQIAWNSVAQQVLQAIHVHRKNYPLYTLVITGHSLGAAIASLATASFHGVGIHSHETYTFGQPRTGNQAYANHIDKIMGANTGAAGRMHRVTHTDDGVTQEPSQEYGFRHHRTEYWELNTASGGQSAARTFRCFGQESPYCSDGTTPTGERGLGVNAAHSKYSGVNFRSNTVCKKKN